jgi:phosphomannomutase
VKAEFKKFVFDVDGTLTPSRQGMDAEFQHWFLEFCYDNEVYLVTGSDYPKTVEQVGVSIAENVKRCYNCSGSDVWESGVNIRTNDWSIPVEVHQLLREFIRTSKFSIRAGNHIEERPGMVNFSIVGRDATKEQRAEYVVWDTANKEREVLARIITNEFDGITATVGGETGIDIHPVGADKSQILKDFYHSDNIFFFGDAMFEGGNDKPLADAVEARAYFSKIHPVKNWKDTWEKLRAYTTDWT